MLDQTLGPPQTGSAFEYSYRSGNCHGRGLVQNLKAQHSPAASHLFLGNCILGMGKQPQVMHLLHQISLLLPQKSSQPMRVLRLPFHPQVESAQSSQRQPALTFYGVAARQISVLPLFILFFDKIYISTPTNQPEDDDRGGCLSPFVGNLQLRVLAHV